MIVPLTLGDFPRARRARLRATARRWSTSPTRRAAGSGRFTYAQFAAMARSLAAALDDLGVGRERARGHRLARTPRASSSALFGVSVFGRVLVPVNFRLNADEIRYIIEHSGSSVLLVDPELDESLARHPGEAPLRARRGHRRRSSSCARARRRASRSPTRTRRSPSTTRPAPPRGPRACSSRTATSGSTRSPSAGTSAMTDRDVYLHTLPTFHCNGWGMPYAVTGMGVRHVIIRKIDGEEILRRVEAEGVTLFNCAPAVIAAVLDAAAARRAQGRGGAGPRARARGHRGGAAALEDHRARRDRARLGVHPDLRPHRDRRRCSRSTARPRSGTGSTPPSARGGSSRAGVPAVGVRMRVDDEGEVLARSNHVFEGYWNQPEETAKAIVDGWFHTGDGGSRRGRVHRHHRPQEGRHHHRRRERLVDRGGGLPLPASRRWPRPR